MTEEYDPLTDDLIERLRAPRISYYQWNDEGDPYEAVARTNPVERIKLEAADALQAQAAEIASLQADADRYLEVRRGQKWSVIDGIGDVLRGDDLDSAIDAARRTT